MSETWASVPVCALCLLIGVGGVAPALADDPGAVDLDVEMKVAFEDYGTVFAVADGWPPRVEGEAERTQVIATWNRLESRLKDLVEALPQDLQLRLALADTYRLGHNLADVVGQDVRGRGNGQDIARLSEVIRGF